MHTQYGVAECAAKQDHRAIRGECRDAFHDFALGLQQRISELQLPIELNYRRTQNIATSTGGGHQPYVFQGEYVAIRSTYRDLQRFGDRLGRPYRTVKSE